MSRLSILRTLCAHWRTSILMRTVAVAATATVALTLVTAAVVFQGAEKPVSYTHLRAQRPY